ncbi:glycerophosphodiester phosphodiesterase family protein [Xanthomarina sp. F1114]|uniref:glycerophosphodiester phosphodiesterase family protein n=1 Tax=Xanthomarina sp. F1114 TaxID=2996019 RepID=UPI00225E3AA0|nr:glycerophosphodiester phosphodiesterase family protein [Xanthomarina sp. F1114]MCX7547486.1 glycerophosphodiester phosphodiesterase family protein [Xanthomarina sp. F1114]
MRITLLLTLLLIISCKNKPNPKQEPTIESTVESKVESRKSSALIEAFKYNEADSPFISVHRGGVALLNYPENCLETIAYVHDSIQAVFEIDIAKTKDNVLVLMHDNTLERTTTGTNKLTNYTFQELQAFNLVDDFGNETAYKIPKFLDVLAWAKKNQAILTIDIKKSVDVAEVVEAIRQQNAEDISIIITYDVEQLKKAYQFAPDLLMSVSARNQEELDWLLETEIPVTNMLAFTGTRLSDTSLYHNIHKLGIKTMLGTLGNLDKQAEAKGDFLYIKWQKMGIDVFATDRPFQAATALGINK